MLVFTRLSSEEDYIFAMVLDAKKASSLVSRVQYLQSIQERGNYGLSYMHAELESLREMVYPEPSCWIFQERGLLSGGMLEELKFVKLRTPEKERVEVTADTLTEELNNVDILLVNGEGNVLDSIKEEIQASLIKENEMLCHATKDGIYWTCLFGKGELLETPVLSVGFLADVWCGLV